ncbi:MAG: ribonuclease P protein component [Pseudomonadales bacterium]|nr:ribonuclease P protein component [Pseudomonadales bacterium]
MKSGQVFTLRKNPSFFRTARKKRLSFGVLYSQKSENSRYSTVIAPKKYFPKAVMRNAVKRRVRAVLQKQSFPGIRVVVVHPGITTTSFLDMIHDLGRDV